MANQNAIVFNWSTTRDASSMNELQVTTCLQTLLSWARNNHDYRIIMASYSTQQGNARFKDLLLKALHFQQVLACRPQGTFRRTDLPSLAAPAFRHLQDRSSHPKVPQDSLSTYLHQSYHTLGLCLRLSQRNSHKVRWGRRNSCQE